MLEAFSSYDCCDSDTDSLFSLTDESTDSTFICSVEVPDIERSRITSDVISTSFNFILDIGSSCCCG